MQKFLKTLKEITEKKFVKIYHMEKLSISSDNRVEINHISNIRNASFLNEKDLQISICMHMHTYKPKL